MERLSTGNRELDQILGGGFPRRSINIVMGLPGTGKTLLAEQLAFANGSADAPVLYLTTLSEPLPKVIAFLQELAFADVDRIGTDVRYESLAPALRERPAELVDCVAELILQHRPKVLVVDSFKAIAELAPDAAHWRNMVFDLASLLSAYDLTAVWVGEYEPETVSQLPEFAIADGILELRRVQSGSRDDRFLRVIKLRGSGFADGEHAFTLSAAGLTVYPRLVGPRHSSVDAEPPERLQTGISGLDEMIESGWLRGTSTLVIGVSGAGKSMLGLHFLRHGADHGEAGLLVNFQESPRQLRRTIDSLGWDSTALLQPGALDVLYTSPVELHMDTIIQELLRRIAVHDVRRVVIDALGDLERAARDPRRFSDYMYALTQELAERRVTAMLVLESLGPLPTGKAVSEVSDNTLLLSMELGPKLVRTIRVLKTRGSAHDGALRALRFGPQGMLVE